MIEEDCITSEDQILQENANKRSTKVQQKRAEGNQESFLGVDKVVNL